MGSQCVILPSPLSHCLPLFLSVTELKASLRDLEHKNADLKFLNNQYVHKVKQLEKDSKDKSDVILKLQEKNFHAVVQTPGWSFVIYTLFSADIQYNL